MAKDYYKEQAISEMQLLIRKEINPLFKIADVVFIDELPRTASGKIKRRSLRRRYQEENNL